MPAATAMQRPSSQRLPALPPFGCSGCLGRDRNGCRERPVPIVFTNRGAQAKHWILKKYKDDKGQPLDLVNAATAQSRTCPSACTPTTKRCATRSTPRCTWASASGTVDRSRRVTFEYSDGTVAVHKTLQFDTTYVVSARNQRHRRMASRCRRIPSGPRDSATRARRRRTLRRASITSPATRSNAWRPRRSAAATPCADPCSGLDRRTNISRPSSCLTMPSQAAMVTFRNAIEVPKDPRSPIRTT